MFTPAALAAMLAGLVTAGDPRKQIDQVSPPADTDAVPENFRLPAGAFAVTVTKTHDLPESGVEIFAVTFPSAVQSDHDVNNVVHAEYFRPADTSVKRPAAVVFDILDGAAVVSRGQAVWLASQGVPAVRVVLPYYGPRRPAGPRVRFLSMDIAASLVNVRQGVLDGRRAAQWLASRPEVDAGNVAVVGTSLGSFVGSLVAASEPAVSAAALLLGGGGLVDAFATHPKAAEVLPVLAMVGVTVDGLKRTLAPVDPVTYADLLRRKRLLLIGASRDDVVPPVALTTLWKATGEPRIVWYDATHVGAGAYGFAAMREVVTHLTGVPARN